MANVQPPVINQLTTIVDPQTGVPIVDPQTGAPIQQPPTGSESDVSIDVPTPPEIPPAIKK